MAAFFESARELMLYSPVEEEWQRTTVGSLGDAGASAGYKNGVLVLELKAPLQRRDPAGYGIGAAAGGVIGMGLESPQIRPPQARRQGPPGEGGSPPGMGGPGDSDGGPPGMGGDPGAGGRPGEGGPARGEKEGPKLPKAIKLWATFKLAGA